MSSTASWSFVLRAWWRETAADLGDIGPVLVVVSMDSGGGESWIDVSGTMVLAVDMIQ